MRISLFNSPFHWHAPGVQNNDDAQLITENAKGKGGGARENCAATTSGKKINRYRPPAKGTRIRYSHIRCEFPAGARRRPSKNNFQLPRARDKRAHALARMIRRVGLLVPRCLFLFFRPLRRHLVSSSPTAAAAVRAYHPPSGMHGAPRRPLFCFPLFSGFSGRAAPDTRRQTGGVRRNK